MMMRKTGVLTFFLLAGTICASGSPLFGPSKNELAMQQELEQNRNTINFLKQRVKELNERVDGLTTVIEGLNATVGELQMMQHSQPAQNSTSSDLSLLEAKVSKLESECIKKGEARRPGGSASGRSHTGKSKKEVSAPVGKSKSTLYSEGVRLFQKHQYDEAKKRFASTADNHYKPAASNYYLGEIAYYTKNYQDAIFYFKKSAGIYDQAGYMDTLLLHTAISLEKTGDKAQAKNFYQTVIDSYPGKKSAKIAKKNIQKI